MGTFSKVLCSLLIGQILLGSAPFAFAEPETTTPPVAAPAVESLPTTLGAETVQVEQALVDSRVGPKNDVQHLADQTLEITVGDKAPVEYDLAAFILPSVPFASLKTDVKIEMDPVAHTLSFVFVKENWIGKNVKYKHIIKNVTPIAYAKDAEVLVYLNTDGSLRAMDMGLAQAWLFNKPIPNPETFNFNREFSPTDNIEIKGVKTGIEPWNHVATGAVAPPADRPVSGRSFAVVQNESGTRTLLGLYESKAIHTDLLMHMVALLEDLWIFAEPGTSAYDKMAQVLAVVKGAHMGKGPAIDPVSRKVYLALGNDAILNVAKQALFHHAAQFRVNDQMTVDQMQDRFNRAKAEAQREEQAQDQEDKGNLEKINEIMGTKLYLQSKARERGDFDDSSKIEQFFKGGLDSKAYKIFVKFIKGGAIALGAYYSHQWLTEHQNDIWLAGVYYDIYSHLVPESLKQIQYRNMLPKAWIVSAGWMASLYLFGFLASKTQSMGVAPFMALTQTAARVVSVAMRNGIDRIFRNILDKPNFMEALKLNINPFSAVDIQEDNGKISLADKRRPLEIKRVRPGLDNSVSGEDREITKRRNADILELRAAQEYKKRAITVVLALLATCPMEGIDGAYVAFLMKRGKLPAPTLQEWANNPELRDELVQLRFEIQQASAELFNEKTHVVLARLDPDMLLDTYKKAREKVEEIKSRPAWKAMAQGLYRNVIDAQNSILPALGNYSLPEADTFAAFKAKNHKEALSVITKSSVMDFFLTLTQKLIWGARADSGEIDKLSEVLEYNKNHPDQLAIPANHLAAAPTFSGLNHEFSPEPAMSSLGMPFGLMSYATIMAKQQGAMAERAYDPIEFYSLVGEPAPDSRTRGAWEIAKQAAKFAAYDLGTYELANLKVRLNTAQYLFSLNLTIRVLFGQSFSDALLGYGYSFAGAGQWFGLGWLWDIARNGIQKYKERTANRRADLLLARSLLSQGLRFDDMTSLREGYSKLYEFYNENLPQEFVQARAAAEHILSLSPEEIAKIQEQNRANLAFNNKWRAKIDEAMTSGDMKSVQVLEAQMRLDFKSNPEIYNNLDFQKLDFMSLLTYSLKHPPYSTEPSTSAIFWINTVTSVLTTLANGFIWKLSLQTGVNWEHKYMTLGMVVPALHAGTLGLQNFMRKNLPVEVIAQKWQSVAAKCRAFLNFKPINGRRSPKPLELE